MSNEEFTAGYEQCLRDLEQMLDASIRRHHGARTAHDGFFVMNDVIYWTHSQKLRSGNEQNEFQEATV